LSAAAKIMTLIQTLLAYCFMGQSGFLVTVCFSLLPGNLNGFSCQYFCMFILLTIWIIQLISLACLKQSLCFNVQRE